MNKKLEDIVEDFAYSLDIPVRCIKTTSRLREDLGMDSLDAYELVYKAEIEFDIVIEDEFARKIETVQDALDVINERLGYLEKKHRDGCKCQECGKFYKVDLVVPNKTWELIKPEGKEEGSGLLCGCCMINKIESLDEYVVLNALEENK